MRVKFMGILSVEAALKAVENDGYALRYVPAEVCTEAVALKAVESDGDALQYVLDLPRQNGASREQPRSPGAPLRMADRSPQGMHGRGTRGAFSGRGCSGTRGGSGAIPGERLKRC